MKKLIFMFLLFTATVLSQPFTIRSLSAHGTPLDADLFLFSNSAGALTKLNYWALRQALDDASWAWSGTHAFTADVTTSGTSDWTYSGDNTWAIGTFNLFRGEVNFDGFSEVIFFGTTAWVIGSTFLIPHKHTIDDWRHLGYTGADSSALMTFNYGTALTDTIMTWRQARADKIYGSMGFQESYTVGITLDIYSPIERVEAGDLWNDGLSVGDLVWTGDSIQVTTAGDYIIAWDLSLAGSNGDHFHVAIFVNNVLQSEQGEGARDMSTSNIGSMAGHTILTISATHWISLRITNWSNSNDAAMHTGNFNIIKQ